MDQFISIVLITNPTEGGREWGWCRKHEMPAARYESGGWDCWYEFIIEADGDHDKDDFELRMPGYVRAETP